MPISSEGAPLTYISKDCTQHQLGPLLLPVSFLFLGEGTLNTDGAMNVHEVPELVIILLVRPNT